MRLEPVVDEHAVAALARLLLQRHRDQIPESSLRQRVLIGKEPVVRVQSDVGSPLHRLGQQERAELARKCSRDGVCEEEPDMAATSRTGPLQRRRELQLTARLQERSRVLLPSVLVEVNRKEEARLVLQHRVHAGHERLAGVVVAGQVPADDVVGDREKASMVTLRALDARLLAHAADPLVRAGRGVAGLASLAAFEASRVDVFATPEQRAEERDLRFGRRGLRDERRRRSRSARRPV